MFQVNLMKSIASNILILKLVGHWPIGNRILYAFYTYFVLLSMFLYNFTQSIYVINNITNIEEVAATVYNLMSTVAALAKVVALDKNIKHLEEVVRMLDLNQFQPRIEKQKKILDKAVYSCNFLFYCFFSMANITMVSWTLYPVMDKTRRLPSNAWFPFDSLSTEYYAATYIWQTILINYHSFSNISLDTLFACLAMQIGGQIDILGDSLVRLGEKTVEEKPLREELVRCIQHYELILKFYTETQFAFDGIALCQITSSALSLCGTMIMLSMAVGFNANTVMFLTFAFALFTQNITYCWFGNETMVKSQKLLYCVFQSNWTEGSRVFKKDLLFFMGRLQNPIVLQVGYIFPINLVTFTGIFRSSWAYFTALSNISHNEK